MGQALFQPWQQSSRLRATSVPIPQMRKLRIREVSNLSGLHSKWQSQSLDPGICLRSWLSHGEGKEKTWGLESLSIVLLALSWAFSGHCPMEALPQSSELGAVFMRKVRERGRGAAAGMWLQGP